MNHYGREMRLGERCLLLLLVVNALASCAVMSEYPDGTKRIVGFVDMTVPGATSKVDGMDSLRVRMLGISLLRTDFRTDLSLGYSEDTVIAVRGNACVRIESQEGLPVKVSIGEPVRSLIYPGGKQ